jgi:hypothetical protein
VHDAARAVHDRRALRQGRRARVASGGGEDREHSDAEKEDVRLVDERKSPGVCATSRHENARGDILGQTAASEVH